MSYYLLYTGSSFINLYFVNKSTLFIFALINIVSSIKIFLSYFLLIVFLLIYSKFKLDKIYKGSKSLISI